MNIELLVKKFYEGSSTQEEEHLLTEYFLNETNIDERWKEERQLFRLLHDSQIQVPADVSKRLESLDCFTPFAVTEKKVQPRKRTLYYWISSAAAVALLCIGLFFATREPVTPTMTDTFNNPKEAALAAEQTLAYMSTQLNKGLNKVADTEQKIEKANQIINKHLN
jgi:hypothetical protein